MSADNWTKCPRCLNQCQEKRQEALAEAQSTYGKIPADEYAAKLAEAEEIPEHMGDSLREDWEINTNETGEFFVSYSCRCACGFKFSYQHEEQIAIDDRPEVDAALDVQRGQ